MKIDVGKWESKRRLFATRSVPIIAGVSGGRTSAMMAALFDDDAILTFQNTGREHPKTYEYLARLNDALNGRIVYLEFRPPPTKGAPPREFSFAIVNHETADRAGGPFAAFLQCLADYRATKGDPPLAPWALGRICTSYMKQKVKEHYAKSLGLTTWDNAVGLRADEPERVARLRARETAKVAFRVPLFDAGITKPDVLEFWSQQPFDLELQEYQGNCTGCFLKDYADIARALNEPESDAQWWLDIERRYQDFGGRSFPGYAKLMAEGPHRIHIEADLRAGREPINRAGWDDRRFHLTVKQEERRIANGPKAISCNCEQPVTDEEDAA